MKEIIDSMNNEIERLRRENSILREVLKDHLTANILMAWHEMSDEEAEAQAEKEITWMVQHNEGAE